MKIKNKESFLEGMAYAAGLLVNEGFDFWKDAEIQGFKTGVSDKIKHEIVQEFEMLVLGYRNMIEETNDKALNLEFED